MPQKIGIYKLADTINNYLTKYSNISTDNMKNAINNASKTVQEEIEKYAPKNTGAYSKSWTTKKLSETSNKLKVIVYSKKKYQLAHLLEYGHAKRGGGRVNGKVHIATAEQIGIKQLETEIERCFNGK